MDLRYKDWTAWNAAIWAANVVGVVLLLWTCAEFGITS
jgi:hypothetical protein